MSALGLAAAIVVVALVAGVGAALALRDRDPAATPADAATGTTTTAAPATTAAPVTTAAPATTVAPTTTAVPTTTTTLVGAGPVAVPDDWLEYRDTAAGYSLYHPADWAPRVVDRSRTDFVDRATGDYLRVDWVRPPGPDAVAGWEAAEPAFASRVQGYRRVAIEPARFGDHQAALWEYTYGDRHASNLAILAGNYGFALNFQTSQDRWADRQGIRATFEAGFRPPG